MENHFKTIINRIINDDLLFKAIYFDGEDFLKSTNAIPKNRNIIEKDRVFPYAHIPDFQKETKTYITMEIDIDRATKAISHNKIHFYILTHHTNENTAYGFKRTRFIMDRLKELFHLQNGIGIGKTMIADENKINVGSSNYFGFDAIYSMRDFI